MPEINFRALCAEILQTLDQYEDGQRVDWDAWRNNARAALAQPEPEGPADEELEDYALQNGGGYFNCDCQEEADILTRKHVAFIKGALDRWARPAIEPVPVAERLPGSEDCNAEGECWWWDDDDDKWVLHDSKIYLLCWTHWLPHHSAENLLKTKQQSIKSNDRAQIRPS